MKIQNTIQKRLLQTRAQLRARCCGNQDIGCPVCSQEMDLYKLMAEADIPFKFWQEDLSSINNPKLNKIIGNYIHNLKEAHDEGIGVYLAGSNGVGKTLAASVILKEALRQGYTAQFLPMARVIELFCDGMYDQDKREQYRQTVLDVDFLVLDDIDKKYKPTKTDFVDAAYDTMFRQRCNTNLPIILTANVKKDELYSSADIYSVSLLSLFDEHVEEVVVTGKSQRKEVKRKKMERIFNGSK